MKKRLLIGLLCLSAVAVKAQGVWLSQATGFTDVSSGVRNVCAVDSNVVWISSYDGSGGGASRIDYSRTIDGGLTWVAGVTGAPASYDWSMINAVDANNAWAVYYDAVAGAGGGIWHTSDGGATWAQQGVGTIFNASSFPDVVHFWDVNTGFAMGDPNGGEFELYTTTDGGATWVAVPGANIPDPIATTEYGIVGHYSVFGNDVWFDTNKGRVYHSVDKGLNWTVAATGITVPSNGLIDIAFYSSTNGIARLYNNATGVNTSMKATADGGATWTTVTPTGNFFGSDVKYVPGTAARLVSTGAATGFIGSSYSDDGGLTWVDIETSAQRTALGIVDSINMWAGGFTTSPTSDGIFKYTIITPVACADPTITPGTATASTNLLCDGDTLTVTSTGIVAPTVGDFAGVSWAISTADITGSTDPLNDPSFITAYTFNYPAPSTSMRQLVNDGALIGGPIPYGVYYWTPIVFGNATAATAPPVFLNDLLLDPACTMSGTSLMVNVVPPGDPLCINGINELHAVQLAVNAVFVDETNIDLKINSASQGKTNISIYDVTGRKVYTTSFYVTKGSNHEVINVGDLGSVTYIIVAETGNSIATAKLVKL